MFATESFPAPQSDWFAVFPVPQSDFATSAWFRESVPVPAPALGRLELDLVLAWTAVFARVLRLFPRTRHSTGSLP